MDPYEPLPTYAEAVKEQQTADHIIRNEARYLTFDDTSTFSKLRSAINENSRAKDGKVYVESRMKRKMGGLVRRVLTGQPKAFAPTFNMCIIDMLCRKDSETLRNGGGKGEIRPLKSSQVVAARPGAVMISPWSSFHHPRTTVTHRLGPANAFLRLMTRDQRAAGSHKSRHWTECVASHAD